jgi:hypothetical protein
MVAARRAAVLRFTIVFAAVAFLAVVFAAVFLAADLPAVFFLVRVVAVLFRSAVARFGAAAFLPVADRFFPACFPDVRLATNTSTDQLFTDGAKGGTTGGGREAVS